MKAILCIDDTPVRYRRLLMMAEMRDVPVLVTHDPDEVAFYLKHYHVVGTCLDHDMPTRDGMWFVQTVGPELTRPVITSLNQSGAHRMEMHLKMHGMSCIRMPCTTSGWEQRALDFWGLQWQP